MIEHLIDFIIYSLGIGTGVTGYQYYQKKKQEKMAEGLSDMAEGIDEEELDL